MHFRFIEAAARVGNIKEVERVCKDSQFYDAERVKDFLMDEKLADPRSLIHVCDRYGFIEDLVGYLHSQNPPMDDYICVYVEKVASHNTPRVVGKLLDMDCNEEFIKKLLNSVRNTCPVAELVDEVDKRNRLRMLQPWLEARVGEGNTEAATHNAIGKLYVRLNNNPQEFLTLNQYYDSKVLGPFCEKLDPFLAFLAYKRAAPAQGIGECDEDLLRCCYQHGPFKDLSRHL